MTVSDEYRRNAKECQRMAENAGNAADKASWLRLASSWLGMVRNESRSYFSQPDGSDRQEQNRENEPAGPTWPPASDEDSKASH